MKKYLVSVRQPLNDEWGSFRVVGQIELNSDSEESAMKLTEKLFFNCVYICCAEETQTEKLG